MRSINLYFFIRFVILISLGCSGENKDNNKNVDNWLDGLLGSKFKQGVYSAAFENENGTTYSIRDGDTALLDCKVYLRHNKTVSWLRHGAKNSLELLTVGDSTYTGDSRINVSYKYPNNYRLNITNVKKSDAGRYVCQISTFPPKGLFTYLKVEDALLELIDSNYEAMMEQFYNPGSEIALTCIIRSREDWATDVMWMKENTLLDLYSKPSISIGMQVEAEHVLSRLWIREASLSDSGNYSCIIQRKENIQFPRAKVNVHVVEGSIVNQHFPTRNVIFIHIKYVVNIKHYNYFEEEE
ncbi:zwei Ig domain protein zig-8 isoform X2 [Lepeophtheirus salmonis]|uniref:zwei Ig domain protein zig-8 isoform X2 n=1 Tax=Lepeophtheirus salmonis TaxID=72036 RepID=UPI003AF3DAF9